MKTNHSFKSSPLHKKILLPLFALLFFSCSVQDSMKRKGLVNMNRKISGSYQNATLSGTGREVRLSRFFYLDNKDSIVEINSIKNRLVVSFIDSTGLKRHKVFEGKFKKKYYQFHLGYNTLLVPPLVASLYEDRVRLSLNENGDLVVNNYYENSGMILFLGAGSSWNSSYIFTKNK